MAIVALCLAVAGPATCGISAVVGAILGNMALKKIRADPHNLTGAGMAKAGVIVGWSIGGLVIAYILVIVVMLMSGSTGGMQ